MALPLVTLACAADALAIVSEPDSRRVAFDSSQLAQVLPAPPSVWPLPVAESDVELRPSGGTLRRRLEATMRSASFAEPIRLRIEDDLTSFLARVALPGFRQLLRGEGGAAVDRRSAFLGGIEARFKDRVLELDARDLSWLDLNLLSQQLKTRSRLPKFRRKLWTESLSREEDRERLALFFGQRWQGVLTVMAQPLAEEPDEDEDSSHDDGLALAQSPGDASRPDGPTVPVVADEDPYELDVLPESDEDWVYLFDFLPEHMQDIYGRYSAYRGRNCFATALQFDAPRVLANKSVNSVREQNHHAAMINSDEFSSALWRAYSPLTEEQVDEGLRFGDLVVFFDETRGPGYRSLLHTAVHVGGRYYFHKPSKSASSPVEFTRWDDMVRLWRNYAKRLGYQVFRRNPVRTGTYPDLRALSEKINWTP